ncbi:hypothetical protein [Marinobacterium lutimaris]|uniref:Uncharacterized protein n=1 Tax=Marinobacterium lutimaris TaxID=568106 RepID=A0A1H5Y9H4_9GAMM|nr:hypothetical protein [Marinobacterium lutimaris]SEG20693.1 hypothetical protein SAMN05444390_1011673 [Marinobacterium lutimaris]
MAASKLVLEVRISWWLRWYIYGVIITARLTGLDPNWTKVKAMIDRGVKVGRTKAKPSDKHHPGA